MHSRDRLSPDRRCAARRSSFRVKVTVIVARITFGYRMPRGWAGGRASPSCSLDTSPSPVCTLPYDRRPDGGIRAASARGRDGRRHRADREACCGGRRGGHGSSRVRLSRVASGVSRRPGVQPRQRAIVRRLCAVPGSSVDFPRRPTKRPSAVAGTKDMPHGSARDMPPHVATPGSWPAAA